MKTAPKDGKHILIAYPSFSDNGEVYYGMGKWVDCPHSAQVERECREAYEQGRPAVTLPNTEGHWEVAYVAVFQHGGAYNGYSYEPRSVTIRHPFGWQPLPAATKAMKRATETLSYLRDKCG